MPARTETGTSQADATDILLAKLDQPTFDAVDFLNASLPVLNLSSQSQLQKTARSTQIQSASADTLSLLSTLNTANVRASSDLTSLTDEIIRSGNRLAYEVEVLRGDVNGMHELLTESLREDIAHFVLAATNAPSSTADTDASTSNEEPEFMSQLRLLGKVKARLEAVIGIFGEAMKWPVPPSEVSVTSSLISVSAPELGIQSTEADEKAWESLKGIRADINELLKSDGGSYTGLEAAAQRVEEFRQLAQVWKGTSEEKARTKFVDTLAKSVEDRRKTLDSREVSRGARTDGLHRPNSVMGRSTKGFNEGGAAGLFRNLQRLKDDLYLE
ncbi:hypothetical protein PV08_02751 [Exophiala spinifera]|uniref:Uncharacterized protein n=1 Tax=Exophiala spinifera TaxID=91928 RepID=A0A0D2BHQ6_9EURO|nr:uncharacterized protein PV08_02751 [Exophiala spinifera]KIW18463.1 hypothetical protein PV08_02751 [Exophiala spinifera]